MIKVVQVQALNSVTKEADVGLKADTKSEVTTSAEIIGLPDGYTIGFNSWVMTASGDIALRKSDGTWNWIE